MRIAVVGAMQNRGAFSAQGDTAGLRSLAGVWVLSGTLFARTGLPSSILDSNAASVLSGFNYNPAVIQQFIGEQLLASSNGGTIPTSCGRDAVARLTF